MTTLREIGAVTLPEETQSYKPVPHLQLIKSVKDVIKDQGFEVTEQRYELGRNGQHLFGNLVIAPPKGALLHEETTRLFGFRNSYDKSMPAGFVAGANVIVCSNLMFEGDIKLVRRHTTNVWDDIPEMALKAVKTIEEQYAVIVEQIEKLKQVRVDKLLAAEIVGEMFMHEEIITSSQLILIKKHWDLLEKDVQTGWEFMNHCTEAMKVSRPFNRMNDQLKLNQFVNARLTN